MIHGLSKTQRLSVAIGVSSIFFAAEISVGFYTHSLALVADAFHNLNDLVGFIVAFAAFKISERENSPDALSFGWQRASLLGAFFNGTFLLALGVSIFLQSVERFVSLQRVQNPMLIMIMGCVGLVLNIISVIFLHEHDDHEVAHGSLDELAADHASETYMLQETTNPHAEHRHKVDISKSNGHSHDLGMMAVLMHIAGDAINNIGVIIAAAVIWKANYDRRFYADPAVSMGIAIMITLSGLPVVKRSGQILLESVPLGVSVEDVKHDLEKVSGSLSIHELHIWRLSQHKALASVHVFTTDDSLGNFMVRAKLINECLHAYGIHSSTLQPELVTSIKEAGHEVAEEAVRRRNVVKNECQISCGTLCENLTCCGRERLEAVTRAVSVPRLHT